MQYSASVLLVILTSSMFTFIPNVVAEEWKIYELSSDDQTFKIPYKINHGAIDKMVTGSIGELILFAESDVTSEGFIEITIPRNLLDASLGPGLDDVFIVLVDGHDVPFKQGYEEISNSPCFRTVSIKFPAASKKITIFGGGIPEEKPRTSVAPVYIATDKTNYEVGETITVSGCTNLALKDKEVIVEILNPQGKIYRTNAVIPNIDGSFSTSLVIEGELAIDGTYTAKATYAGQSAMSSFVVPEFPIAQLVFAVTISIIIAIFARTKGLYVKNCR